MPGKLHDLAQPYFEGMPHSPILGPFHMEPRRTIAEHGYRATQLTLLTHIGTHLDAPAHFIEGGRTIDQLAPEELVGECVICDLPRDCFGEITDADLDRAAPDVEAGGFLFIRTGFGAKFTDPDYNLHPCLTEEAARWLVARRIALLGVDFTSPDLAPARRTPGFGAPVHRALLGSGVLIVEHLYLEEVIGKRLRVYCFPLKIAGGDGAPVRVIGEELR